MFGKVESDSKQGLKPKPGGSSSNRNLDANPDRDSNHQQKQAKTYVDQSPLNLGSQSSQHAPTLTSADHSSIGSDLNTSPHRHENENDEGRSVVSAHSYRSDIDAYRLLREVDGRIFNALNEAYFLPSDSNEWARLAKQHIQMILTFGALYPAKETVDAVLAPNSTERKRILDLGTGSGIWAIDMAKKFSNCEVIGIDVAPVPVEPENLPPNCHFEMDDIQLGLGHFHLPSNQFDLIHARFISGGLQDFRKALKDVMQCLKPGGLIIWIDADYQGFSSETYVPLSLGSDIHPNGSWMGRIGYEAMRGAMKVGGSDFMGMAKALDEGFWDEPLMDPTTCRTASLYTPVGPWASHEDPFLSQRVKYAGALMRQNLRDVKAGLRTILRKANWPIETIDEWQMKAAEELSSMKPPAQYRTRLAWGRRRNDTSQPTPLPSFAIPFAVSSTQVSDESRGGGFKGDHITEHDPFSSSLPYPFLHVYETPEQALAETERRKRERENFVIPPMPP